MKRFTKKEEKAWELERIQYIIISRTSNFFITISKQEEHEWERKFVEETKRKYTEKQIDEEIAKARKMLDDLEDNKSNEEKLLRQTEQCGPDLTAEERERNRFPGE